MHIGPFDLYAASIDGMQTSSLVPSIGVCLKCSNLWFEALCRFARELMIMRIQHINLLCCMVLMVLGAEQPTSAQMRTVRLRFAAEVYGKPLTLGDQLSTNRLRQTFTVSTLKYYIGHITLVQAGGPRYVHADHALIDFEDSSACTVTLRDVPYGIYIALSFVVGVDSIHSVGGPMEGGLDPLNGMYWTWATGFIFVKCEGTSPQSPQPKHQIEYHLGGFAYPYRNMRTVNLDLTEPVIVGSRDTSLEVSFDVGRWLDACGIDFSTQSSVTDVRSAGPLMDHIPGAFRANP